MKLFWSRKNTGKFRWTLCNENKISESKIIWEISYRLQYYRKREYRTLRLNCYTGFRSCLASPVMKFCSPSSEFMYSGKAFFRGSSIFIWRMVLNVSMWKRRGSSVSVSVCVCMVCVYLCVCRRVQVFVYAHSCVLCVPPCVLAYVCSVSTCISE